ncbi:MAG: impB/mucB/samB family protein [Micavibrio sp.]|nr:impB/mucB/samB family protein [Micavibrio sp.]
MPTQKEFFDSALPRPEGLRWLYVDFNSYFASVEQQLQPRLRGRPVIVVPVDTDYTSAIAASYEAKAFGVRTGTPVHEAKRMCPGLVCVLAQHDQYVDFHQRILRELDNHIPVTAVCSIDEMACRLLGRETEPARAQEIARGIKAGLAKNVGAHVRCSIGFASNRYLAKVATDMQKPDGMVTLFPEDLPGRLLDLKLRDLPGIGYNMEKRLNIAGIWDVATLFNYAPRHLRAVWGSIWGEKMWYYLRGYDIPEVETTRSSIGHSHVLAPELRPPEEAFQVARRLTMKCAARLRRMGYSAGVLTLSIRLEEGPHLGLEAHCQSAQDSFTFLRMLDDMWRGLMHELKGRRGIRIKKVSVTLLKLGEAGVHQTDLFDRLTAETIAVREKCEKISAAVDKLNKRFGRDTVLHGMTPQQGKGFSGTKIAFTRIPDVDEFLE